MKSLVITKNKLYYVVMFIIIYCSHDTLLFGTNSNGTVILFRKIIPFLLCGILCVLDYSERRKYKGRELAIGMVVLLLPFFSCVINKEEWDNYIYRFAIMLCALLYAMSVQKEKACRDYNSILMFLSVWSVGVFLVANTIPSILSHLPVIVNTQGIQYANTVFSVATKSLTYGAMRNHCIFREPGVFVVYLTIAYIFEFLNGEPEKKTRHLLVFTIAMLTTMSTAGYIILALIFIYIILVNRDIRYKPLIVLFIIATLMLLITQTDLLKSDSAMFSKFAMGTNSYGSWFSRMSSVSENIRIAMNNPIFGVGRYSLYNIVLAKSGVYVAVDNTNTILIGFAAYGILFGIILLVGCWKFIRRKDCVIIFDIFLLVILLMALSNEDLGQNIIFYYIVFAGLTYMMDTKKKRGNMDEIGVY